MGKISEIPQEVIEVIDQNVVFQLFPNYIKSLNFTGLEKHCVWLTIILFYILFMVKLDRLIKIQKRGVLLIGFAMFIMHILSWFKIEGYYLLIASFGPAGIFLFLTICLEKTNYITYPAGFYLVTLCTLVYTIHFETYYAILSSVFSFFLYLAIIHYLNPELNYIVLRAILASTMLAMFIKMSVYKELLSLDGDTYFFITENFAAKVTSHLLYFVTIIHFVIIYLNEIKII